jgi:hypothetical protein
MNTVNKIGWTIIALLVLTVGFMQITEKVMNIKTYQWQATGVMFALMLALMIVGSIAERAEIAERKRRQKAAYEAEFRRKYGIR